MFFGGGGILNRGAVGHHVVHPSAVLGSPGGYHAPILDLHQEIGWLGDREQQELDLGEEWVACHLAAASASASEGGHMRAQRAKCYDTCEREKAMSHYFGGHPAKLSGAALTYSLHSFPHLL